MTRNRDSYEARLVRTVLYSADVLPEKVSAFLAKVSERGYWDIRELVLGEFRPLVDHLPAAYVDFALSYLIPVRRERGDFFTDDHWYFESLGIRDDMHYFPPAHVQGPFLYLLRRSEDEGLRLINALANKAVEVWREREQTPYYSEQGRTPLPLTIRLPSGTREFWGDERVYLWFRSRSVGPHSVASGLMALEVWMEDQIRLGRDPEELFQKVLAASDCVAVPGVCLSVTLAFPSKCLKAALPIVGAPMIWRLDVARAAQDSQGPFRFDPFGSHKFIYDLLEERDKLPQRAMDVRSLAALYVFSSDGEVIKGFQDAVARFTDLPFQFEDEKQNAATVEALRHRTEAYQALGDPANYRAVQSSEGIEIRFETPEGIKARDAEGMQWVSQYLKWASVSMWAQKALEEGKPPDSMSLAEAIEAAKSFETPEDFGAPYRLSGDTDSTRLQAIAGVAAAALRIDFDWVVAQERVDWCKGILLSAARAELHGDVMDVPDTYFPQDPKVSAGRGLGKLAEHARADQDVREQILKLVADPHYQVVQSVFVGIRDAWDVDRCLCWNVLSLGLTLSCPPRIGGVRPNPTDDERKATVWVEEQVEAHLANLRSGILPDLPAVGDSHSKVFLSRLVLRIVWSLPLPSLLAEPENKAALVRLMGDLMKWTVERNKPPSERRNSMWQRPYEWNFHFFRWAAEFAKSLTLEETRLHVLTPVRESWAALPHLTADLLYGYIVQQIGFAEPVKPETLQAWGEMADWVLESQEVRARRGNYHGRDVEESLSLLVLVRYGRFMFDDRWPHSGSFVDVIDKWVKVVGHYPHLFASLIVLLSSEPASQLDTSLVLKWLHTALNARNKSGDFWGESSNGESTSRLLQRIWSASQTEIKANPDSLQTYSNIVDELVKAGIPLAGAIQQELERRA